MRRPDHDLTTSQTTMAQYDAVRRLEQTSQCAPRRPGALIGNAADKINCLRGGDLSATPGDVRIGTHRQRTRVVPQGRGRHSGHARSCRESAAYDCRLRFGCWTLPSCKPWRRHLKFVDNSFHSTHKPQTMEQVKQVALQAPARPESSPHVLSFHFIPTSSTTKSWLNDHQSSPKSSSAGPPSFRELTTERIRRGVAFRR